jgi:predicted RND superfamily exporter protein
MKKTAIITYITILLISAFFGVKAFDLEFDYDFEAFFSPGDPSTEFFTEHRNRFETDNDFVLIAIENEEGVFQKDFLRKVADLSERLPEDTLVVDVQSLTSMTERIKTPFSAASFTRPFVHVEDPEKYAGDSTRIVQRPEANLFLRKDAKALLVFLKHDEYLSKQNCDVLKNNLVALMDTYEFDDYKLAGRAVGIGFYIDSMKNETVLFIGLSFILVIFFLIFSFKSAWGVIVPLSIVSLSMLWIVGFMAAVGQPFNLVLTVLPSIIFVVAMSDVIHLVTKYIDELRLGKTKFEAVKIAYKEIGVATLLTSVTTSIGFLSLLSVSMEPVRSFGIYTSIGVLFAFILAYTFLPAMLILTKPPKIVSEGYTNNMWYPYLHKGFRWVLKKYKLTLVIFLGVLIVSVIGLFQVKKNYYLLEDLKPDNELRKDYAYFDQEFMGLRPFEMSIEVLDTSKNVFDYEVLLEIAKLEEFLLRDYGLKQTVSIIQGLKIANRMEHGGQVSYYKMPDEETTTDFIEKIRKFDKSGQLDLLVDSTKQFTRLSSTIGDIGRYEIDKKNERLAVFIQDSINTDLLDLELTGTGHLLDYNMSDLSNNLTQGLFFAIILVSLIMGLLYRSVKMVLIALVPNILPLVLLAALMGYFGIDLKVSTAIIFTISFGIAVDDTIHFMSKLKLELNKNKPFIYALKRTYLSTGRAIVLTTLILCSGFLMLLFSDFLGTYYIGLLISATLFFALLSDLFVLPALLILFPLKKKKKK